MSSPSDSFIPGTSHILSGWGGGLISQQNGHFVWLLGHFIFSVPLLKISGMITRK